MNRRFMIQDSLWLFGCIPATGLVTPSFVADTSLCFSCFASISAELRRGVGPACRLMFGGKRSERKFASA